MNTPLLPIADAHVHLWDLERHLYPWLLPAQPEGPFGKTSRIRHSYLLDDYCSDVANQNVQIVVHVEAGWDPSDPLGEVAWIQSLADARGLPHAHIAHIDLASSNVAELIKLHAEYSLFRGIRDRVQEGDFAKAAVTATRLDDPTWRAGMSVLERHGLLFELQAPPTLATRAANLVREHPGVRFVLTHGGYPPPADDEIAFLRWREGLELIAQHSNVFVKMSGLMLVEKSWNPNHAKRAANALLEVFGIHRVMVSSNFPVDRLFASLNDLFDHYRLWLQSFGESDQRRVLHDNTCSIYRIFQSPGTSY
jgi:predicted TIM-barrel fold metal-dependent hydrolase